MSDDPMAVQRIVVAMDASSHSRAALEAAVTMAERFGAELLGLFVEDVNVLRIAGLPYAHEFGVHTARRRIINREEVERNLRVRSRQVERDFTARASRAAVRNTFRVTRGSVNLAIQTAAAEADVLIVGRAGWSELRKHHVGSTARALCCSPASGVTAILQAGVELSSPVMVVYDASPSADRALGFAVGLDDRLAGPLQVLLIPSSEATLREVESRLDARLKALGAEISRHRMALPSVHDLIRAVDVFGGKVLVVPACLPALQGEGIVALLEQVETPVLMVQ